MSLVKLQDTSQYTKINFISIACNEFKIYQNTICNSTKINEVFRYKSKNIILRLYAKSYETLVKDIISLNKWRNILYLCVKTLKIKFSPISFVDLTQYKQNQNQLLASYWTFVASNKLILKEQEQLNNSEKEKLNSGFTVKLP